MNITQRVIATLFLLVFAPISLSAQGLERQRVIVLTDIEADPDDAQSLVRLLTYSNDLDIKGLIATTSMFQKERVAPESIHALLAAYEKVQSNLLKHSKNYPTAAALKVLTKKGIAKFGMEGVGEGKDSEGSEWIIKTLESADTRPLWVSVWGGPNCLAQALWKIQKNRSTEAASRLYKKLRVYTISDQDDSGPWIRKTFPEIFYVVSPQFAGATWGGITRNNKGANNEMNSNEWLTRNIQQGHGPLGAAYPDVAYGMEGDTPSYLGLIPNGLNVPERPDYGGWGGRYELSMPEKETRLIWTNAKDTFSPLIPASWGRPFTVDSTVYTGNTVTIWRWMEEFQNDFAARMDWTVKGYKEANHPPVPKLGHPDTLTVKSGTFFSLNAAGTFDPDGDALSYYWFQYIEAGTYKSKVSFAPFSPNLYNVHTIKAPAVTNPQTAHFILQVTDKGTPALTRYKRVIVRFVPN